MPAKVLLVDDEPLLVRSTSRILSSHFDTETYLSGKEALAGLESGQEPHVIVSDLNMPEMNGIAFLKKAHELAPNTSLYMLSGNQDAKMRQFAETHLEGIVEQFICKPCNPTELVNILNEGVQKSETKLSSTIVA